MSMQNKSQQGLLQGQPRSI